MRTEDMRLASEAPIPWKSPVVILLRISGDAATAASRVADKDQLLTAAGPGDLILAAGQYRQDVFVVDNLDEACAA